MATVAPPPPSQANPDLITGTCETCGGAMTIVEDGQRYHPGIEGDGWQWRRHWDALRGWAVRAARRARAWRLTLALPGLAGTAMVSVGLGLRVGLWLGIIVGGVFLLRIDGRL
jgi:hypothetical protein